jgi:hypothetical protein
MRRDIVMRKLDTLARCVARIEEKRPETVESLIHDIDVQDILSINLERAVINQWVSRLRRGFFGGI